MKQENNFFKKLMSFAIAVLMCLGAVSIVTADGLKEEVRLINAPANDQGMRSFYSHDFTTGLGTWTVVDGGDTNDTWMWDALNPGYGVVANSDAAGSGVTMDEELISPAIDCTGKENVELQIMHTINTGSGSYSNQGDIYVSNDGMSWTLVRTYPAGTGTYTYDVDPEIIDISDVADDQSTVYLKFHFQDFGSWGYLWQIWNVELDYFNYPEWPGHKMHYPQLPNPEGWDVFAMMPDNILADDFMCTESGPITDLHFWGSWFGDIIPEFPFYGAPDGFHISFHEDIPADESPTGYSMPGDLLWEADIFYPDFECLVMEFSMQGWFEPPASFEIDNHEQYFQYDIFFEEPYFIQEEGTIYWVDIAPMNDPAYNWGWKTTLYNWNDDAVYWGETETPVNIFEEDFDGTWSGSPEAPDGWTVINADDDSYYWSQDNTYISPTHSEPYAAHGMGNNDDWLITPEIDLTGIDADLKWWDTVESSTHNNSYKVLVSTTTNDTSSFTDELGDYDCTNTDWTEHTLDLSSYNGETIYVAFYQYYSDSTYYGFGIDDVSIGYTETVMGWNEMYEPPDFETSLDLAFVITGEDIPEGPVLNVDTGLTYFTIQEAIDDPLTIDGHTITVDSGNYDGGLLVDKSLTLIGAGKDQTVINTSSSPVITVSADDVTIQNLGITDSPELGEGIRVVSPASSGLTVDTVAFTELGAGTGANAYGIYIDTSFSNLSVVNSDFISAAHTTSYRTIGIFTPNSLNHNDFEIMDSTFTTIWTSIYLRSAIDGFIASGNLFESVQASDLTACVAGIYMGDGDDDNFDLENINIYENTFTEYGRGVYIWNYGENSVIDTLNIYDNLFENSIWSAAIRVIAGLGDDEQIAFQDILVDNNQFTQDSDVGAHVGMIDFRTYCALSSCDITITNNDIAFTGGPYTDPMSGILFLALEGPFTNTIIENNELDGGNTGGTGTPPSSGILLNHQSSTFWPSDVLDVDVMYNNITDFENGVSIYDIDNSVFGGLSFGSMLDVNYNNIYGNTGYGIRNDEDETIDATCNWWGDISGPSGEGLGTGDAVSTNVTYLPWLDDVYPVGDCVGGYVCWNVDTGEYFGSIQDGIDDVDTLVGHTIEVFDGTFDELIVVDKDDLTIKAENQGSAIIQPSVAGSWPDVGAVTIRNDGVTVDGFEVDASLGPVMGINVYGCDDAVISNNTVHGADHTWDAIGIGVWDWDGSLSVDNALIENNIVYDTGRMGIMIMDYDTSAGEYDLTEGHVIRGNTVYNTWTNPFGDAGGAIQINVGKDCDISDNLVYNTDNDNQGIYMFGSGSGNEIMQNEIRDNSVGIQLWIDAIGGSPVDWEGDTATSPAVFDNNIYDNVNYGAVTNGGIAMDATCNWWGNISGPSGEGPGTGDAVSVNVTYLPWLDDVYPVGDCVGGLNEDPTAAFSYDPVDPTTADLIQFTDESTDSDGVIVNWTWDFGDGTMSYDQDPTHQYTIADTYTVCLTVTDDDGATDTICESIVVDEELIEVLDIEQAVQDRPFLVRHASDGDWGGAQNFTPTVTTITKVELYMKVLGTPDFDLTVELREDSIDGSLLDTITMTPGDFSSDWEWIEFDFADVTVVADTDYFVVLASPPAGMTNTFGYGWGYSLGDTIDDSSLWFTRTSGSFWLDLPELYDFTFRVYGYEVFVDQPPTACFDWSVIDGTEIGFDASCSTDDVGISSYEWDFDDGTHTDTGVTVSYNSSSTDPYNVTLTVTDTIGQIDSITQVVTAEEIVGYFFDFEDDDGGWVPSTDGWDPVGDWEWTNTYDYDDFDWTGSTSATPPPTAYSGTALWGTLINECHSNSGGFSYLTKTFDLSGFTQPEITWQSWEDAFGDFDYCQLRVNGDLVWGPSWDYSGTQWRERTVDLSAYAGLDNVEIQFELYASSIVNYAGWYIDDVSIQQAVE